MTTLDCVKYIVNMKYANLHVNKRSIVVLLTPKALVYLNLLQLKKALLVYIKVKMIYLVSC